MNDHLNIRARRLHSSEWMLLKRLRLQALESDPASFWESVFEAVGHPDSYWQQLAADTAIKDGNQMFILEDDQNILGFVYAIKKDDTERRLGGLWVKRTFRGRGYGELLVRQMINWAKEHASSALKLWAPLGPTVKFYERLGFCRLDNIKSHPSDDRQIVEMELHIK